MLRNLQPHTITHKPSSSQVFIFFIIFFFFNINNQNFVKSHIFIYAGCSQEKYTPNSPFESNLNSFLSSSLSSSPQSNYNSFSLGNNTATSSNSDTAGAASGATVYGLYQCRSDLKPAECTKCVESAINQIGLVCPYGFGASLQLEGCLLRYERVDFLGKPDLNVMYKKCSKENGGGDDVEFLKKRDYVVSELESGGVMGFKVSSSGSVEGFGQCLGDLSSSDCGSCLGDAVRKLKGLCGSAAAADVFLAQCYARYWASGYYDTSSDSSKDDQMGKTVAIIVGSLAGLAVLIVVLSFCRKVME